MGAGLQKLAGVVLWSALVVVKWVQAQFVHPLAEWWFDTVLATWEESFKSVIREVFAQVLRIANSVLNVVFRVIPGYQSVHASHQKRSAWQDWHDATPPSTLNAIISRYTSTSGDSGSVSQQASQTTGTSKHQTHQPASGGGRILAWFARRNSNSAAQAFPDNSQKKRKLTTKEKVPSKTDRPAVKKVKRNGSELFDRPAGWAVQEKVKRGFLEDLRIGLELFITALFDAVRRLVRKALFMPDKQPATPPGKTAKPRDEAVSHKKRQAREASDDSSPERTQSRQNEPRREENTDGLGDWKSQHVWTVASVIKAAGYKVEQHAVTTDDGYKLRMERLPRKGGRDVVFFMHGILDTSMGWVSNGVTGSQAFAAYDQGFDVWLGNSRANPPRKHEREEMNGMKYWHFTVNELGQMDIGAQLDYIDATKRRELLSDSTANQQELRASRKRPHRTALRVRKSGSLSSLDGSQQPKDALPSHSLPRNVSRSHLQPQAHTQEPPAAQAPASVHRKKHHGTPGMHGDKSQHSHHSDKPASLAAEASSEDDADGYASPREDLEVVSPESSPFRAAASQEWQRSHQQHQAQQSNPHTSPHENGSRRLEPLENGHGEQRSASGPNANGRKHNVNWQAAGPQQGAQHAGEDPMQPDLFAVHGVSQDPAGSMSGRHSGLDDKHELGSTASGPRQQPGSTQAAGDTASGDTAPYRMRAVGHSLGGASLLIYAVSRSMANRPTHLCRLILLTPAGFQQNYPRAAIPFVMILPVLVWAMHWIRPGMGAPVYIPSSLLRYITFKLTVDLQQIPALNELVRAGLRVLLNGDSSQWDRAMQMPHYNTASMPSISFHTGVHIIQWIRSGRFQLYDYRNAAANQEAYGCDKPPDMAANYGALPMPVDIMAGKSDGVIAKENVLKHYNTLKDAGCNVTYKEFDFGHLDFTFAMKDDLRHYVLSRLRLDSDSE